MTDSPTPVDGELHWRRIALHLARQHGESAVPVHFGTVSARKEASILALASAMFSIEPVSRFAHPEDALDEARLQLDPNPVKLAAKDNGEGS